MAHGSPLHGALQRVESEGSYTAYMAAANALASLPSDERQPVVRVGVVRNFTIEPILPVLAAEMAREGMHPDFYVGDFDTIAADALDPSGPLARFDANVVVVAQWLDGLSPLLTERFASLAPADVSGEVDRVVRHTRDMLAGIRRYTAVPVLLNNFPLPTRRALGILDAQRDESQTEAILAINRGLREIGRALPNVFIVDYLSLFAGVGSADGFDIRNWVHRRSPVGRRALVPVGQEYGRYLRALRSRTRKCVVVDCDNTLWGGIVGEDGLNGIQVGDAHPGSRYSALQRELINLYDRGVLIALCSKNNEADVLEVLRQHPGMVLRETHVAAHRINWEDKASNLRAIAQELNIGLDSLVFVDDSPFECGLVREQLPEVAVVQVKPDDTDFGAQLARHGYFDALVSSREDSLRTRHFKAEAERRELQSSAGSLEEYLASLGMVAEIGTAHDEVIPRIAQLTQKTNQFNLTTRRYTEADITAFAESATSDVVYLSVRDKVADLGIVGVAIMRSEDGVAEIDSFLMSCRALGRGVELVMLDALRRRAEERGDALMRGAYIPTAKNSQVAHFYESAGFAAEPGTSPQLFTAQVASIARPTQSITIVAHPTLQTQTQ